MLPSSSDLTYFAEVATTQNLTRAAERLGISQPSLTLSIQRLETSLGTQLLIRSKKGVSLTQAGRQLLLHTKELMQRWDEVKRATLASNHEVQGSFTIGCHTSVARYSLPLFMQDLLIDHPKLDIRLTHDLSRKISERVVQLEVDLGIVVNPSSHPDLVIKKLCQDEVGLWRAKGRKNPLLDIEGGTAVLIGDPDLVQTQAVLKKLSKTKGSFARMMSSSSLEVIASLTAAGAGIGILPGRVAAGEFPDEIVAVPQSPTFTDELCVVYHTERRKIKALQVLVEHVTSSFKIRFQQAEAMSL